MTKQVNIAEQKMMPFDTDTERAVLSTLIHYNEKLVQYSDLLDTGLFYYEKEKAIFRCIDGVVSDNGITDVNSLFNYAKSHQVGYDLFRNDLVEIVSCGSRLTLEQDILRLRDMGQRRECWRMLQEYSQEILDMTNEVDTKIEECMQSVVALQQKVNTNDVSNMTDAIGDVRKMVDENQQGKKTFLKTGLSIFDEHYLLRPGTLTVIAAFTSVGKSALAMNITENVACQGIPCAYYSLEMSKSELAARMLAKQIGVPASVIMNRKLNDTQMKCFEAAEMAYKQLPIYFDDRSTIDFNRTMRSIKKLAVTKKIKLAVIDYLQIYGQVKEDAEESISYMARTAKNVAMETGVPIIVLSQLNRSAAHPSIRMLRGSGQIEESADNVVLIDRPEAYPESKQKSYEGEFKDSPIQGTAKLILAKGRGVGTCCSLVAFSAKETRFADFKKADPAGNYEEQTEDLPF